LGSITSLTDSAGATANTYTYDAFGNQPSSTEAVANPFRYTAREFDSETGLYYYRARYYDSQARRFLSEDPIGLNGGINLYAYVGNNPLNLIDPLGQAPPDGHHLFAYWRDLNDPLAREFASSIKTGPLNLPNPNQPGFQTAHRLYNVAVEEIMLAKEGEFNALRNTWCLSQWRQTAWSILNSNKQAIKNYFDLLKANNPGAISTLGGAIAAYKPTAALIARIIATGLMQTLRGPLLIYVDIPTMRPGYRENQFIYQ
jgi:RHS repeat-associated protein